MKFIKEDNITKAYLIINFVLIIIIPYVFILICGFLSNSFIWLNKYANIIFYISLMILFLLLYRWVKLLKNYRIDNKRIDRN